MGRFFLELTKGGGEMKKHGPTYGLIAPDTEGNDPYTDFMIPRFCYRDVVTSDLPHAKNHCAATAIANLALYFANIGTSSAVAATPQDTLRAVYQIVGNGPILFLKRRAKRYFQIHGEELEMDVISRKEIPRALAHGHICVLLLRDGLFHWHWVLAVGERVYASGRKYIMVMDGWHRGSFCYLALPKLSSVMFAMECRIKRYK